jgi:leader peptidase (prepilin peptidase)/N-methyltransferase
MNSQLTIVPNWVWVVGLLFGATIGSFLNVVIYRLPRGLSLSNPPKSFCPNCKHSLGFLDLFPLFSYLFSGGKCRYCKQSFSSRYFWVELLNGTLWAVIWWQFLVISYEPLRATFYCLTTAALVAVFFIDWELYIIPDELNATLLVFGVAYQIFNKTPMIALSGAFLGWLMLWGIALFGRVLFGKDAMGHGDIKMMRGVGALLGPPLLCANMGIAVIAGLVIGLAMIGYASLKQKSAGDNSSADSGSEEDFPPPESIVSLLVHGAWYLLCLDIVGLFVPRIYKLIGESPSEELLEDDDWKPSLTTIPFGPYLAIGAVICMLFAAPIEKGLLNYWKLVTHATALGPLGPKSFVQNGLNRLNCAFVCDGAYTREAAILESAEPVAVRGEVSIGT